MRLTAAAIDGLKADGKRREIPDAACKGLYLFVLPSGTRAWYARYRNTVGKQCRLPLGTYPDVGLAAARGKADEVRVAVREGHDPAAEKMQARERAMMDRDRLALGEVAKAGDPFKVVWAVFDAEHIGPTFRPGTAEKWRRIYRRTLAPRWDSRPLSDIASADIYGMLKALQSTPDAADSALTVCKAFFNWAIAAPRHLLPANPCNGIGKVKRRAEDAKTDDRILSDAEIRWLWLACEKVVPQFAGIVRMLLLTGARRNEVANMTESEVDEGASLWTLPAARSKNGKAHRIHLSTESLAVLKATPHVDSESDYCFSTNGRSPVSGFGKFKAALDREMAKVAESERGEPVKVQPWRLHSLRKTFASGLARLGVSLQVAERCLNHSSGSLGGIVSVYNRHSYAEEQAAAWDTWGRNVASIVTGKASNVLPMRRA